MMARRSSGRPPRARRDETSIRPGRFPGSRVRDSVTPSSVNGAGGAGQAGQAPIPRLRRAWPRARSYRRPARRRVGRRTPAGRRFGPAPPGGSPSARSWRLGVRRYAAPAGVVALVQGRGVHVQADGSQVQLLPRSRSRAARGRSSPPNPAAEPTIDGLDPAHSRGGWRKKPPKAAP